MRVNTQRFALDEDRFIDALTRNVMPYEPSANIPNDIHEYLVSRRGIIRDKPAYDPSWFNTVTETLDCSEQVLRSLVDGSCAYAGVVPQAAIIEVIDDEDSRYGVDWRQRDRYQKIASKVAKEYGWREP